MMHDLNLILFIFFIPKPPNLDIMEKTTPKSISFLAYQPNLATVTGNPSSECFNAMRARDRRIFMV